jgi:hypothetical protein
MGIDFSVPVPADKQNEPADNAAWLLVVQKVDSIVVPVEGRAEYGAMTLFSAACVDPRSTVACVAARYAIKNCLAPALCDTARHERSGVQLA